MEQLLDEAMTEGILFEKRDFLGISDELVILEKLLEEFDFNVSQNEEDLEIEAWTDGGVNMVHYIRHADDPFEGLNGIYEDFNTDEEVRIHLQDKTFEDAFTLREALGDFEGYKDTLRRLSLKAAEIKAVRDHYVDMALKFLEDNKMSFTQNLENSDGLILNINTDEEILIVRDWLKRIDVSKQFTAVVGHIFTDDEIDYARSDDNIKRSLSIRDLLMNIDKAKIKISYVESRLSFMREIHFKNIDHIMGEEN